MFFPQGMLWQGVLVITAFVFSDLIDGAMARKIGPDRRRSAPSSTPRSTGSPTPRSSAGSRCYFAWQAEDRLYLVLTPGDASAMGAVTSYARAKADGAGYDAKVGHRRAPGPAGRRCWSRRSSPTCSTCRSCCTSRCGCWRWRATVTVVQRIWVVRRQALAARGIRRPAPRMR